MLLTLRSLILEEYPPFQFDIYNDQLFWSQWLEYSVSCDVFFQKIMQSLQSRQESATQLLDQPKSNGLTMQTQAHSLHLFQVLQSEVEQNHISMRYAYFLQTLQMMLTYIEWQEKHTLKEKLEKVYFEMFDEALEAPDFEIDQGMIRASMEVITSVYLIVQADQALEDFESVQAFSFACEQFNEYVAKTKRYACLVKNKLIKSESFRLESDLLLLKNQSIIQQYIGQTQVPEFAKRMLNDYWALKMSLVQSLGQGSLFDWQFYWTFVTRFVRYFKINQAISSPSILNDEYDFLSSYLVKEAGGFDMSYEMSKFMYAFRSFHIDRLTMVQQMQKAKRTQKPRDVKVSSPDYQSASSYVDQHGREYSKYKELPLEPGQLFWYREQGMLIACELTMIYKQSVFVLSYDHGRQVMSFDKEAMIQFLVNGRLVYRLNSFNCHHSQQTKVAEYSLIDVMEQAASL